MLVAAPFGRDADSVVALLSDQGYRAQVCPDLTAVVSALDDQAGVVVMTEEALAGDRAALRAALDAQPAWSDIPFVLLAARRPGQSEAVERTRVALIASFTNAIVLERPIGSASLTSTIASAMRSRQKQFETRDRLMEVEAARRATAASEAELRLIADSLPVLIAFVTPDLHYRFANRAYEDWMYKTPDQVIGRRIIDIVGADAFAEREAAMRRALAGEEVRLILPWPHRDGRRRDADIRYLPRHTDAGGVDGFYIFAIDITDRREVEEDLERAVADRTAALEDEMERRADVEAALRQSQKMEAVGQLTGGIAHDFNNMLTGVIGAMDIMKRRLANGRFDDLERFMDAASVSAQRAAALTARLLAFSRRQSLDMRATDVDAVVASLEDLLLRSVRENIRLTIVPHPGLPPATTDVNQLENAILNLAINARDAMPDGGTLTIETTVVELDARYAVARPEVAAGRYVVVSVSDTGVGMEPEVLERVFEPFFSTKPMGEGTGLGLSMVYGFARQAGGQVRVHSQPGMGTSVKLFLPVAAAPEQDADDAEARPAVEGDGQSVLLVEDDPSVRLLVRQVLEDLRYVIVEAGNADQALPVLTSDRHLDLMVSDVGLPGMNGRQLAEIARRHRPDLPVLFVTGYAENAAIRSDFLGTNMDMISKPFSIDALANKIAGMMATHPSDA
ncbi:PAS/PAC sensor hybrid histidine kinase [Sphingomonas gellani]|uniref:histidine kinase n=1 Tax=Sphingomonas gellani TaxID=1166340 RepID=A0A1H8DIW9_9SPHN|nr:PAS domain-containing sensor histidine kinase [Sphingomonas gellani]SEN07292.1 PAS/PAC sensor hybrid histidine kinase [Sphingomonas gellani]